MSVVTMRSRLTDSDIRDLVKGLTEEDRARAALKICKTVDSAELSAEDRAYANEILALMARDAAALVRGALSVTLQNSPRLPPSIARKLAEDIDAVALPVLENSPSLSDADLIAILRSAPPSKQIATARRSSLSEAVTEVLCDTGVREAVETALKNTGASFGEAGLMRGIERFGSEASVTAAMAYRKTLPLAVTEKLVSMVTGAVFDHLVNQHELPPQMAIDLAISSRERATIDLVEQAARQNDLARFAQQLNLHGRLTPSMIMRALCMGHMSFAEHALAELTGLPHHRVWLMMHDSGPLGLDALFERSGLPARLLPPFRTAIEVFHDLSRESGEASGEGFRQRMIQRVLTLFRSVPRDDLDYLLDKLDAISAAGAAQATRGA